MKFTTRIIDVLKNFSAINQSILFKPGRIISTTSPQKTIIASAVVDVDIEQEFAIYDLHEFLGILSLMQEAEAKFGSSQLTLTNKHNNTLKYTYAHPSTVVAAPYKDIEFPDSIVLSKFTLPYSQFNNIIRACNILKCEDVLIECNDGDIEVRAGSLKDKSSSSYSYRIDDIEKRWDGNFTRTFKIDAFKLITTNYIVTIPDKKLIQLTGDEGKIKYWIATSTG
jgi:hypothetical protein